VTGVTIDRNHRRHYVGENVGVKTTAATRQSLLPPLDLAAVREGVRVMSIPAIGIAVWGLVTGVAMVNAGLPMGLAILFSLVSYAGSAQLAILPLLAVHAPLPVVWATAALVNLRFVIFAAAQRKFFARMPWKQRLLMSYFNGDVGSALFMRRYGDTDELGTPTQWGFYAGVAGTNYVIWHLASIVGIVAGDIAPASWGLDLAAILALVAVIIPMIVRIPMIAGVVVTGALAVATAGWPMKLGLLFSVVAGVCVALVAESFGSSAKPQDRS
jgi:predicted branched-subunit amino acid permease